MRRSTAVPTRTVDRAPSQTRTVGRTAVRTSWNDCTVVRALQLLLLSSLIFIAPLGQYFDRNPCLLYTSDAADE